MTAATDIGSCLRHAVQRSQPKKLTGGTAIEWGGSPFHCADESQRASMDALARRPYLSWEFTRSPGTAEKPRDAILRT